MNFLSSGAEQSGVERPRVGRDRFRHGIPPLRFPLVRMTP